MVKSFGKILVANRGEIAVRIIRTCRNLGIATVAIYSDADLRAPHVKAADEAFRIGPAPAQQSYLNIDSVIQAGLKSGADAIHPGYGFLSENADFADACGRAGIVFIGPSPDSIRAMGLKSAARRLVAAVGVPLVPGYDGDDQNPDTLAAQAREIGFPVLIKASAGGGGKGMRVVHDASELLTAIESSAREAEKAFGDNTLLLEKYIEGASHVEIQIIGDRHGSLIHLFERDCSIQRRHQKIVEESPSPALNGELRERMGNAALAVGKAIGYSNACTVEFILAPSGEYYFIEVNTRLQVEHPVTEMITGLDLVALQIKVAEGKPLGLGQQDIARRGCAIEARLYAEDPENDFLPAAGVVRRCDLAVTEGIRVDAGIETGSEVGIHYDPMLAKIIAWGEDRETALRRLAYGLEQIKVHGVITNKEFLVRVLKHEGFRSGNYHTGFIAENPDLLISPQEPEADLLAVAVVALYRLKNSPIKDALPLSIPLGYRNNPYRDPSVRLRVGGRDLIVSYWLSGNDSFLVQCEDWRSELEILGLEDGSLRACIEGRHLEFAVTQDSDRFYVQFDGVLRTVEVLPRYPHKTGTLEHQSADAPMPGQVLKILVENGQKVSPGDPLVVLEAMKMEQTIRAASHGIIEAILVKPGEVVSPGESLIRLAAASIDEK